MRPLSLLWLTVTLPNLVRAACGREAAGTVSAQSRQLTASFLWADRLGVS